MVIANAAAIPLYYDKVVRFISKDVEGITLNPMNLLELKRVRKSSAIPTRAYHLH
jgi:peptide/nickel transport system substrate-binding protein